MAWRNGESASLQQELEHAECLEMPGRLEMASTLDLERLEALSGAVESLRRGRQQAGAVRLLEHLAKASARPAVAISEFRLRNALPFEVQPALLKINR
jgi:hypothetical protein